VNGILSAVRTVSVLLLVVVMAVLPAVDVVFCPDGCADAGRTRCAWQGGLSTAAGGACGLCLNGLAVAPPLSHLVAIHRIQSAVASLVNTAPLTFPRPIDQPPRRS
jgi:hypothetical protein